MSLKRSLPAMRRPDALPISLHSMRSASINLLTNNCAYSIESLPPPSLPDLPQEIIQQIFLECPDITSVVNLSSTSRQFREAYLGSQKLLIIENALEAQFGPLYDAIQIVAHNQSQAVYLVPEPPMSMALAKQIAGVGYVAQKWEQMYPMLRWRDAPEHRRLLRPHEAYRFRRALYRLWLYSKAFHREDFLQLGLPVPFHAEDDDARLEYVRLFDHDDMQEMRELNDVLKSMLIMDLCPSDAIIQRRYNEGFPGEAPLYFGSYHTHSIECYDKKCFCRTLMLRRDLPQAWVAEAWGPRDTQVCAVRNVLKLEPDKLLYFKEQLSNRSERLAYLATLPESFHEYESSIEGVMLHIMVERASFKSPDQFTDSGIIDFANEKSEELLSTWKWSVESMKRPKDWTQGRTSDLDPGGYSRYSYRGSRSEEVVDENGWEEEEEEEE